LKLYAQDCLQQVGSFLETNLSNMPFRLL
jgi:hypothetical protein